MAWQSSFSTHKHTHPHSKFDHSLPMVGSAKACNERLSPGDFKSTPFHTLFIFHLISFFSFFMSFFTAYACLETNQEKVKLIKWAHMRCNNCPSSTTTLTYILHGSEESFVKFPIGYATIQGRLLPIYGEEPWSVVKTGVLQKSVLSPLLFVLLMDQRLKQAACELVSEGDQFGTFAFADDIGLVTCSATELKQSTDICVKSSQKLNAAKSEVMVVSWQLIGTATRWCRWPRTEAGRTVQIYILELRSINQHGH